MREQRDLTPFFDMAYRIGEKGAIDYLRIPAEKRPPPVEVIERVVKRTTYEIRDQYPSLAGMEYFQRTEQQLIRYVRLGWWGVITIMQRER